MDKKTLNCSIYQEHLSLTQLYQKHLHGLKTHNNYPLTTVPRIIESILRDNNKIEWYITLITAYKSSNYKKKHKKQYNIEIGTYCDWSRTIQISKNLHHTTIISL